LKRSNGPECGPGHGGITCGDRLATFIMVLRAPIKGGKTVFPNAVSTRKPKSRQNESPWYCYSDDVLGVTPSPGDGILFWDYRPPDSPDDTVAIPVPGALHSGCPVEEGEKWVSDTLYMNSVIDQ